MNLVHVTVVGATGYGGAELMRLLGNHPAFLVSQVTSARSAGTPLRSHCPWLPTDLVLEPYEAESVRGEIVFLAQEAGFAMREVPALLSKHRVIDFSADFRLKDPSQYPRYYKFEHVSPGLLDEAVYGLPELVNREEIAAARLVAVPGCHATASSLAIAPLVRAGIVPEDAVVVADSKTGVSGAGRSRKETEYLFSELVGSVKAYAVTGHRHTPEIEMMTDRRVRFTPHLVPMSRGIEVTAHVPVKRPADIGAILASFYDGSPLVRVSDRAPDTKEVVGSGRAAVWGVYDDHTGYAVVTSVIDNLGKGAAAAAVQNANLMVGLPEETGLTAGGLWP